MLSAKLHGRSFKTEIPILMPERIPSATPVADICSAKIALITTGGLVPRCNPERQKAGNPDRYYKYSIEGKPQLDRAEWEAFHAGYFNGICSDNPNYVLPLAQMRTLEAAGEVGGVHPWIFTLPGVGTPVVKSQRLGGEIADELMEGKVDGALLVAT
jgi:glycine reductase